MEICCCHFSDVGRWILVFSDENSCARKAAPYCPSGKRSAKLTLGNGKVVKLVPDGRFTLAEMDGTVIQKDSTGIDYRQIGVGEDTLVYNQMETLTGMEYTLTLSDGTRVYLNAESRLKYSVAQSGW